MSRKRLFMPLRRAYQQNQERGFTLLEMLVALAILSGSLLTIFAGFSWSLRQSQQAAFAAEARVLAQSLLAEATAGIGVGNQGETQSGLSWQVQIRPYGTTDKDRGVSADVVVVDVRWPGQSGRKYALASLVLAPQDPVR